jgi:hypothetical protein
VQLPLVGTLYSGGVDDDDVVMLFAVRWRGSWLQWRGQVDYRRQPDAGDATAGRGAGTSSRYLAARICPPDALSVAARQARPALFQVSFSAPVTESVPVVGPGPFFSAGARGPADSTST